MPKGESSPNTRLELSQEEMRSLGYRVIDLLVEHTSTLSAQTVSRVDSREALEAKIHQPLPVDGEDPARLLDFLSEQVFHHSMVTNHPRFFAFVPSPSNFVSVMADALISGYNSILAEWAEASGPATLELTTVDWLRELCGMPAHAGGIFVSGGSAANLTALAVAREVVLQNRIEGARVYCSEQTHASNRKALKVLGFSTEQVVGIPLDQDWRIDCDALHEQIQDDRRSGWIPFCIIGNAGTTSTGAVDPIARLREISQSEKLWLHVDGAYGAAAVITERGTEELRDIAHVDSLAIDPHKWLFQPFEIGCVLVRNSQHLTDTFGQDHVYLRDVTGDPLSGEVNLCDAGIQLTRNFRALKLWLSLKTFGLNSFRSAMDYTLDLATTAQQMLAARENVEICTPARLAILTFRFAPSGWTEAELNALNLSIVQWMIKDGRAMLSSTQLGEKVVLRLCTINPRTTEGDLELTVDLLSEAAETLINERKNGDDSSPR